jgi:hypothetical protein
MLGKTTRRCWQACLDDEGSLQMKDKSGLKNGNYFSFFWNWTDVKKGFKVRNQELSG